MEKHFNKNLIKRSNKLNKHIWFKNNELENEFDKPDKVGNLLFNTNSLDAGVIEDFNVFDGNNDLQPKVLFYIPREKRSLKSKFYH